MSSDERASTVTTTDGDRGGPLTYGSDWTIQFPVTASLKLKIGQIVLVLIAW